MSRRTLVFVLAWLALAGSASATQFVATVEAPVRLAAPAPAAVLRAGGTAEIAWEPLAGLARIGTFEEWEAFLSLDGGQTYPLRITPHLDRDLRRVQWRVPPVPAAEARLLLRFGNEGRETYFELPRRFSIAPSPTLERTFEQATVAAGPGEPALPGAAGVVAWIDGSRRGGRLRQMVAPERPAFHERVTPPSSHTNPVEAAAREASSGSPEILSTAKWQSVAPTPRISGREPRTAPFRSAGILLLTQRRNE